LRWLTEAQNSGTGEIKFYIDDVEQTTTGIPYNYTSSASDIGKHTDPLHYVLILKGIADYDFVRVWEP
jgi:hypothetical protein